MQDRRDRHIRFDLFLHALNHRLVGDAVLCHAVCHETDRYMAEPKFLRIAPCARHARNLTSPGDVIFLRASLRRVLLSRKKSFPQALVPLCVRTSGELASNGRAHHTDDGAHERQLHAGL